MADIEKAVAKALRLSSAAAEALSETILQNIDTARAELIRSGVSADVVSSDSALITDAVITFCQMRMDDASLHDAYATAFYYMQDNLRKSYPA